MRQGQLSLEYRLYAGGRREISMRPKTTSPIGDIAHWLTQILDRQPDGS
jgi:hypothetical protein